MLFRGMWEQQSSSSVAMPSLDAGQGNYWDCNVPWESKTSNATSAIAVPLEMC